MSKKLFLVLATFLFCILCPGITGQAAGTEVVITSQDEWEQFTNKQDAAWDNSGSSLSVKETDNVTLTISGEVALEADIPLTAVNPATTLELKFDGGSFNGKGKLDISGFASVKLSGEIISGIKVSDTEVTWNVLPEQASLGIINSSFTNAPITVPKVRPVPFVLKDSQFTKSEIAMVMTNNILIDGVTLDHTDIRVNALQTSADILSHQITDSTLTDSSLILDGDNNSGIFTFDKVTSYDNTKGFLTYIRPSSSSGSSVAMQFIVMRFNDVHAYRCKESPTKFTDVSMGPYIAYIRDCSFEGTEETADKIGVLGKYGCIGEINGLTIDKFGTGISVEYGYMNDGIQAAGDSDKITTSGYSRGLKASWQDFHITNCTNGVAANYQSFLAADSEIFDFSIEGIEDNMTGEGFVMYTSVQNNNITKGSEYLIPDNNIYIHDGKINNFKTGMHCNQGTAYYVDKITIRNTNRALYVQSSIAGVFRRIYMIDGVDSDNVGYYAENAGSGLYLLDAHIDGFQRGGYTNGGSFFVVGGTIENCDIGLNTYNTNIYGVQFLNNKIGWKQSSAPNNLGFCLFDGGDKENAIGIDLNNISTRAAIGLSDVFVLYPDTNTREGDGYGGYDQVKNLAAISETYSEIKRFEIKNCKAGIDAGDKETGGADIAAIWIHDCKTGINVPKSQNYIGAGLEVTDCEIGCFYDSIYTLNSVLSKSGKSYPALFKRCDIGMKQNLDGNSGYFMNTLSSMPQDAVSIQFENCDIGLEATGMIRPPLAFINNKIGWRVPNDLGENELNCDIKNLVLEGNDVGIDTEEGSITHTSSFSMYLERVKMLNNDIGMKLTGWVFCTGTIEAKNSDIEIANEYGLLIVNSPMSDENALTFTIPDESLQETGRFVSVSRGGKDVYNNAEIVDKGLVASIEDPGLYSYTPAEHGGHEHDNKFMSTSPGNPGGSYYVVIHSGCYVNYDYETNGGESWDGDKTRVAYLDGETINTSYTAERTGYRFLGWSLDADNESGLITEPLIAETEEITLYAIFEKIVTITYDYETNGGSGFSSTTELAPANTYETKPGVPVKLDYTGLKDGYEFIGWNTDKDAHTGLTELITEEEDITLYAIYSKTYTTTYHAYGGDFTEDFVVYNNDAYHYPYAAYKKTHDSHIKFAYYQPEGTSEKTVPGTYTDTYYPEMNCFYDVSFQIAYHDYNDNVLFEGTDTHKDVGYNAVHGLKQEWEVKEYTDLFKTDVPPEVIFVEWKANSTAYQPKDKLQTDKYETILTASIKLITTEAPDITVNTSYKASIAPGKIENDDLDKIYYRINGGIWEEYTGTFPVYKKYTIEAYQVTKRGIRSETAKLEGREKPTGITAVYNGTDKELFERVIPEEVTVTVHYPNSPDETTTEFTLENDIIMKEGSNTVTAVYHDPDDPAASPLTDDFNVNGILPPNPKTAPPVITVSPDCKVTIAAGPIQDDLLDKIYYRINDGQWKEYTGIFPVYKKYKVDAYQTTKEYALQSSIVTVSGTEYPTGITAKYTGEDKLVGDHVEKQEVTVTVHYPNSPDETTTNFTLEDTEITHPGLNDVTVKYTEYPEDPKCPHLSTSVSVNGYIPPEPPEVTTDPPVITVSKDYKVSLTPGEIKNDTLDHIYYRINGGEWHIYKDIFPVYKEFKIEAYQKTKTAQKESAIVEKSGREYPSGITAEYTGEPKDIGEKVPPEEIVVTVHYPNSPDETTTNFTLEDDVIEQAGPNNVTVNYKKYPDDPDCPTYSTTVEVIGVYTPPATEATTETTTEITTSATTTENTTAATTAQTITEMSTERTTSVTKITEEKHHKKKTTTETETEAPTDNRTDTVKTGDERNPYVAIALLLLSIAGLAAAWILSKKAK